MLAKLEENNKHSPEEKKGTLFVENVSPFTETSPEPQARTDSLPGATDSLPPLESIHSVLISWEMSLRRE